MNKEDLKLIDQFLQAKTPGETRDIILQLGFNGLFFQRWYPDIMDNWEGYLAKGFLEHYYASQLYKSCPVARTIHQWRRSYTFLEARNSVLRGNVQAKMAENLWSQFGMHDGIIVFSGRHSLKSAMVLTTDCPAEELYARYSGILTFVADKLDKQLYPGHDLLKQISRQDIKLSPIQQKILKLQINHPELTNSIMAEMLGISVNTLLSHHKKIAKKEGVTTFTGAVIRRIGKDSS